MQFRTIDDIKEAGFVGFKAMHKLFHDSSCIPAQKGIYLVLNLDNKQPVFLEAGTGGYFKRKNPNVGISVLQDNWVNTALVVYIGKAGSNKGSATLRSRLRQYLSFGQGRNVGHWGGRLIWQLASSKDLIVCWKALIDDEPRIAEAQLIKEFVVEYGRRPFANLSD